MPDSSDLAEPLTELNKEVVSWQRLREQQVAFGKIKGFIIGLEEKDLEIILKGDKIGSQTVPQCLRVLSNFGNAKWWEAQEHNQCSRRWGEEIDQQELKHQIPEGQGYCHWWQFLYQPDSGVGMMQKLHSDQGTSSTIEYVLNCAKCTRLARHGPPHMPMEQWHGGTQQQDDEGLGCSR